MSVAAVVIWTPGDPDPAQCLESLEPQVDELVLTVNPGGAPSTAGATVLENDRTLGFGANINRGIAAYGEPLHVILGGSLKGEDFRPLVESLPANVRAVHLIGEASDQLAAALEAVGRPYSRDGDLAHAVDHASGEAEPGDVVLLSPGCASYDQFRNFAERGDAFRRLVEERV